MGAKESYTAKHRRFWWSLSLREPALILATYMARREPAFVLDGAEARHLNTAMRIARVYLVVFEIFGFISIFFINTYRIALRLVIT